MSAVLQPTSSTSTPGTSPEESAPSRSVASLTSESSGDVILSEADCPGLPAPPIVLAETSRGPESHTAHSSSAWCEVRDRIGTFGGPDTRLAHSRFAEAELDSALCEPAQALTTTTETHSWSRSLHESSHHASGFTARPSEMTRFVISAPSTTATHLRCGSTHRDFGGRGFHLGAPSTHPSTKQPLRPSAAHRAGHPHGHGTGCSAQGSDTEPGSMSLKSSSIPRNGTVGSRYRAIRATTAGDSTRVTWECDPSVTDSRSGSTPGTSLR